MFNPESQQGDYELTPPQETAEEQPFMYEGGAEYGGPAFKGIDFGIFQPKAEGGAWTFRTETTPEADSKTLMAIKEVLNTYMGDKVIGDPDRGNDAYRIKGDPRGFIRNTLMPEVNKKLGL